MELTPEIKESINKSVLCRLETVSTENIAKITPFPHFLQKLNLQHC